MAKTRSEKSQLKALREQREAIKLRAEIEQAQAEIHHAKLAQIQAIQEGWIDPDNFVGPEWRTEPDTYDSRYGFGIGGRRGDRSEGRLRPIFETEQDLEAIRAMGRMIGSEGVGAGMLARLTDYTVHTGFVFSVTPEDKEGTPAGLVKACQKVIDNWLDINDFSGDLDREIHERAEGTDGECFVRATNHRGVTELRIIEPEYVTEPGMTRDLEDWIASRNAADGMAAIGGPYCWRFGVQALANDIARPLGYYVHWDDASHGDWDYFDTSQVQHIKFNVPRNIKRGLTGFYPSRKWIQLGEKVADNTGSGAAIQAAIAFIRQYSGGTSGSAIGAQRAASADQTYRRFGSGREVHAQKFDPGTILDVQGAEYKYGPLGSTQAPNFAVAIQACLRIAGLRWGMPEYMVSGDASNANYSSTMVAESPFVKGREAAQAKLRVFFLRLAWIALKNAYDAGAFRGYVGSYEDLEKAILVECTPPEVAVRDADKETARREKLYRGRVISKRKWQEEEGYDPEQMESEIAQETEPARPESSFGGLTGAQLGAITGMAESEISTARAKEFVRELFEGDGGCCDHA